MKVFHFVFYFDQRQWSVQSQIFAWKEPFKNLIKFYKNSISTVLFFSLCGSSSSKSVWGNSPRKYKSPICPIRMLCSWGQALAKPGTPHSWAQTQTLLMTQSNLFAWHCHPCSQFPKPLLSTGCWEPDKAPSAWTPWDAPTGKGPSGLLVVNIGLWGLVEALSSVKWRMHCSCH